MPRRDGSGPMGVGSMTERGLGLACRRGFGGGFRVSNTLNQDSEKSDKDVLKQQKELLQNRLNAIDKQLEDI